eukprot:6784378-Prorocentrum_lima.AAC.1
MHIVQLRGIMEGGGAVERHPPCIPKHPCSKAVIHEPLLIRQQVGEVGGGCRNQPQQIPQAADSHP